MNVAVTDGDTAAEEKTGEEPSGSHRRGELAGWSLSPVRKSFACWIGRKARAAKERRFKSDRW